MKKIILSIDIQQEYTTQGRPFYISGIASSLANAKKIIETARNCGMGVWHMRHLQDRNVFVKDHPLSKFVEGFEPTAEEQVFEKDMYSCFSSDTFSKKVAEFKPEEIVVIGYGSSMCCLCTIIDGLHRGYRFTLVEDATASRSFPHASSEEMHRSALNVLKQYAKVQNTNDCIAELETQTTVA